MSECFRAGHWNSLGLSLDLFVFVCAGVGGEGGGGGGGGESVQGLPCKVTGALGLPFVVRQLSVFVCVYLAWHPFAGSAEARIYSLLVLQ